MSTLSAGLSTRVTRRRKFQDVSCTECTFQGNDFELIPTVKIETRNHVEGYFCSEFPAICYHCRVMAAWSRKTLKKTFAKFSRFFEKRPLTVKFSTFCSESCHRDTDRRVVFKFCEKNGRQEICEIVRCLPDKKFAWLSSCRNARIAPKICPGQPPTMYSVCSRCNSNRFTFGGVIAEPPIRAVFPIFDWSLASSRITT